MTEMSQWLVTLTPVPATLPGADKEAWQKQTDAWLEAWNQSLAGMDVAEHRFFEPEELKADLPVGGNHQATAGLPRLRSGCCQTRSRIESGIATCQPDGLATLAWLLESFLASAPSVATEITTENR